MNPIGSLIEALVSPLSLPFTIAILGLMAWDLYTHYVQKGIDHKNLNGVMTGTGILGTFFGVVIGLQDFDTKDISASIGPLLDGLKVSFATSVAGLTAAISTEIIERIWPSERAKIGDPVADTLNGHMLDLADVLKGTKKANEEVASNVAAMRTEMKDESKAVREALKDTLEQLSKGATEEIIKALEDVISDFNDNLVEQFGENFKQLNQACLELVKWQEGHKESVKAATESLDSSRESINQARELFEAALPKLKEFHQVIEETGVGIDSLNKLSDNITTTIDDMGAALDYITSESETASKQVRELNGQYSQLIIQADKHIEGTSSLLDKQKQASTKLSEDTRKTIVTMGEGLESFREHLTQTLEGVKRAHEKTNEEMEKTITNMGTGGKTTQEHLNKSLNELEKSLSSLTSSFGDAYRDYLEGLRKLTRSNND